MKRINILDINTSNKIAAGEVVERPFSVVKELIENSLDANSKNITVEIIDGGQKTIKVTDDGEGVHPDDLHKVFLPHATSKITDIDDIYRISTFGFRGEALASIAAVSTVILRSRTASFDYGMEISISGGNINHIKEVGCNIGTSIEINDLFFNVPARLKFMKSSQREAALINDIVERLALVNPNVSFRVMSNGTKVLLTFPSNDLKETVRSVYGKSIYDNIFSFEKHSDTVSVHGYIGNAEISRGSRNNQSIFVNKRYIKNKLITTAVENAFKSFLTVNKYPFFILFIDIFPELVDVNVHPTKSEIKFNDERFIYKIVFDAVHEALRSSLIDSFNSEVHDLNNISNQSAISSMPNLVQIPIDLKSDSKYSFDSAITETKSKIYDYNQNDTELPRLCEKIRDTANYSEKEIYGASVEENIKNNEPKEERTGEAKFPSLNIIGQFNDTYILAQYSEDLYIIDQHAAHEKILFEKYMKAVKNRQIIAQILASPVIIELNSEDFIIYNENKQIFITTGFNIENFGENTISIREVPIILGEINVRNLFLNILDNIKAMGSGETAEVKYDKIAKLSCKSAIKANDKLSIVEMKSLVDELRFIKNPFTCPHGRPTIIKITLNELEKRFKRIQ